MDMDFPAGSSGEESNTFFMDEDNMRLDMVWPSPPRMLFPWSPPPPSPPASAGFGGLWDFDDHSVSSLQMAFNPTQAGRADAVEAELVTVPGTGQGDGLWGLCKLESLDIHSHGSSDGSCVLMERLTDAIRYFKESIDSCLLVQVWAPFKDEGRYVLTSSVQPFVLDHRSPEILQCMMSTSSINQGGFGLAGRVFRLKIPEWTPNVKYYFEGYPLSITATGFYIRVTVALPVFDPHMKSCVAAVELIMLSSKMNFESVVDLMCKGLEAVNLTGTYMPSRPSTQILNKGWQFALADILEIFTIICETHKLPLAQTWAPCCNNGNGMPHGGSVKITCLNLDGCCIHGVCISTSDVTYHVVDPHMWGFRDACVKHHLQKGQGVAGEAFLSNRPCFSKDVSQLSKLDYPLAHYAHMFGLAGCVGVCLQSSYTGDDVYILEFFLPLDCREDGEQKALLESIYFLMKQNMRSLKVSTHRDSDSPPLSDMPVTWNGELKEIDAQNSESRHCESALVFDRSKRKRNNTENAPAGIDAPNSESRHCESALVFEFDRSKRKRSNTENAAAGVSVVQHHHPRPINAPRSKSKSRSKVWNHFTRMDGARAICNECRKDYAADPKIHGTSRLLRHLKHDHGIDFKASSSESGK